MRKLCLSALCVLLFVISAEARKCAVFDGSFDGVGTTCPSDGDLPCTIGDPWITDIGQAYARRSGFEGTKSLVLQDAYSIRQQVANITSSTGSFVIEFWVEGSACSVSPNASVIGIKFSVVGKQAVRNDFVSCEFDPVLQWSHCSWTPTANVSIGETLAGTITLLSQGNSSCSTLADNFTLCEVLPPDTTSGTSDVSTDGTTTGSNEELQILNVELPVKAHPGCSMCATGNEMYICSNETEWNGGNFTIQNPVYSQTDRRISSAQVNSIEMKICSSGDVVIKVEGVILSTSSTLISTPCNCGSTCEVNDIHEQIDLPSSLDYLSNLERLQVTFETDDKVCVRFMTVAFRTEARVGLTTGGPSSSTTDSRWTLIGAIIGAVLGLIIVVALVAGLLVRKNRKNKKKNEEHEAVETEMEADQTNYQAFNLGIPSNAVMAKHMPANSDPPNWMIPYEELDILEELGKGSFGVVYLGRWRSSRVAIKQLLATKAVSQREFDNFIAEATLLSKLRPHANIVQFQGACMSVGRPLCIVTEFMEKGDLLTYLQNNPSIPTEVTNRLICGIAAGIRHLHMESVIHRDLAARNVLLSTNLQPKITDFGMSRLNDEEGEENVLNEQNVGPLKWMAPESIMAREYSVKSDVWAFGVVLYEIITHDKPYPELTPAQAIAKVTTKQARLVLPEGTDPVIVHVFEGCMIWDAQERIDSSEVCARLAPLES